MAVTPQHDGFYIPNAADVSNPRMAEPDKIDFNTLGNLLWGVIEGCVPSVAGSLVTVGAGTYVVNGQMLSLTMQNVSLGTGGAQDRFDLIVADNGGTVKVISGLSAVDPVYPDPDDNVTVLATVFCPSGLSNFTGNLIDKRKLLTKALLTKVGANSDLVRNLNGTGNLFRITGGGVISWGSDTALFRDSTASLTVQTNLKVGGTLAAGGAVNAASLTVAGQINGANLQYGDVLPGSAAPGTIFQQSTGQVYIRTSSGWEQLTTIASAVPVGTIITSVETPAVMVPLGWLPLDGTTNVSEGQYPHIFNLTAFASLFTGTAPTRSMRMPNASKRIMLTDFSQTPGTLGGPNAANKLTLQTSQMPMHKHGVAVAAGGGFSAKINVTPAGDHSHVVSGGSHSHPFNVAPHNLLDTTGTVHPTYPAGALYVPEPAIQMQTMNLGHNHSLGNSGSHSHSAYTDYIADHNHAVSEQLVGGNDSVDVTPEFMTVYTYLRS